MIKIITSLILSFISIVSLAKTIATINGQKIDSIIIDKEISILKQQKNVPDNQEVRNAVLDSIITSTIVIQEAKRLKLDQSKEYKDIVKKVIDESKKNGDDKKSGYKEKFNLFKEQLLIQAYASNIISKNPISEDKSKKLYDDFKKYYTNTDEIKLGNIVIKSKEQAEKALTELKKGTKFQDVAKKYSIAENVKSTGGISKEYVNLKDIKMLDKEMYDIISNLKKGKYSNVIPKNDLYVILYIDDIRKAPIKNYNEIKEQLVNQLQKQKIQESVNELAKKAKVDIVK